MDRSFDIFSQMKKIFFVFLFLILTLNLNAYEDNDHVFLICDQNIKDLDMRKLELEILYNKKIMNLDGSMFKIYKLGEKTIRAKSVYGEIHLNRYTLTLTERAKTSNGNLQFHRELKCSKLKRKV